MKPVKFEGANTRWTPPGGWDREEPCHDLWAYVEDGKTSSCWKPTFIERLRILFGRPVWLHVVGRQPPVALNC